MAAFASEADNFVCRVTGKQSVERLIPLVKALRANISDLSNDDVPPAACHPHFVWETTCEKDWKLYHANAVVRNKLNNTQVIESKSNVVFLQLNMSISSLESYVAKNSSEVSHWAGEHWRENRSLSENVDCSNERDWWAVKASNGNGGKDIWIVNQNNHKQAIAELPPNEEYVIQRYVHRPLLYKNKKFHFRCYSLLMGDMSALVYQKAFILTAGLDFDYADEDQRKHITNLSVNKRFANHPGQIPVDLVETYPEIYLKIAAIWKAVAEAAAPFMQHQSSARHFEFFGMDIIADENGDCWLIEANRLPGLESSDNNRIEEDLFYDDMMRDVLRIVLREPSSVSKVSSVEELNREHRDVIGRWEYVASPSALSDVTSGETYKNLFSWKAFTRRNRNKVLVACLNEGVI